MRELPEIRQDINRVDSAIRELFLLRKMCIRDRLTVDRPLPQNIQSGRVCTRNHCRACVCRVQTNEHLSLIHIL